MTRRELGLSRNFVLDACQLPTAEQPLRISEWDDLFATGARVIRRTDNRHAVVKLLADPQTAARAADLSVRETQCCSFFRFTVVATGGRLDLEVTVPATHEDVLDALVGRAVAANPGAAR